MEIDAVNTVLDQCCGHSDTLRAIHCKNARMKHRARTGMSRRGLIAPLLIRCVPSAHGNHISYKQLRRSVFFVIQFTLYEENTASSAQKKLIYLAGGRCAGPCARVRGQRGAGAGADGGQRRAGGGEREAAGQVRFVNSHLAGLMLPLSSTRPHARAENSFSPWHHLPTACQCMVTICASTTWLLDPRLYQGQQPTSRCAAPEANATSRSLSCDTAASLSLCTCEQT